MPAEIVTMEFCADYWSQFEVLGSRGTVYTVAWYGPSIAAHCTCPAYKFSGAKASCKHIWQTFAEGCFLGQWYDGGSLMLRPVWRSAEALSGECTRCGGPTMPVRVAV